MIFRKIILILNEFLLLIFVSSFLLKPIEAFSDVSTNKVLKIGILLPQNPNESTNILIGAKSAADEFSKKYNVRTEIVSRQHLNQWGQEADEAVEMLFNDGALGIIAPSDGIATHLAFQVAGRTRRPMVSLCSDKSITGATIPWCVRIVPSNLDEVETVFKYLKNKITLENSKWALVALPGRTGREIENDIRKAAEKFNANIAITLTPDFKKDNLKEQILPILRLKPDGVLIWLPPELAANVVIEIKKNGFEGIITGTGRLFSEKFLSMAKNYANNIIVPTIRFNPGFSKNDSDIVLSQLDREKRDYISIMAYDSSLLLFEHFNKCNPEKPHQNFPVDKNLIGWTGELKFDKNGDRILEMILWRIVDGKFVLIKD